MKKQMFIALLLGTPLLVMAQTVKRTTAQKVQTSSQPAQPAVVRVSFPVNVLWKLNNREGSCSLIAILSDMQGNAVFRGYCGTRSNSFQVYDLPEGDYELVSRASCSFGNPEGFNYSEDKKVEPGRVRISVRKGQVPDVQVTVTD